MQGELAFVVFVFSVVYLLFGAVALLLCVVSGKKMTDSVIVLLLWPYYVLKDG